MSPGDVQREREREREREKSEEREEERHREERERGAGEREGGRERERGERIASAGQVGKVLLVGDIPVDYNTLIALRSGSSP